MTAAPRALATLLLCAALAAPVFADEVKSGVSLGLTAGSLGLGPQAGYRFGPNFGVRADFATYSHGTDRLYGDVHYNVDLKLGSAGAMVDWYPFGGGFRLSGGMRENENKLGLRSTPTAAVQIGTRVYTPDEVGTLTGDVSADSTVPVLSLGYGGTLAKGLTAGVEVGAMFQGTPQVRNLQATGLLARNPQLQADLSAEELKIESDASSFKVWPILQVQLTYRF